MTDRTIEIAGTALAIPATRADAAAAVAEGRLDAKAVEQIGVESLPTSDGESAPQLAVRAGRSALAAAAMTGADLDVVAHAWTYYQGHDFWSPAHHIAREIGAHGAIPFGVQQMCNGGAMGVQLAVSMLHAGTSRAVLVTTADVFADDGFDRWGADFGLVYGDSGTALLLRAADEAGRHPVLLGTETVALSAAEEMHRGDDPFGTAPRSASSRIDVQRTKRAYIRRYGLDGFHEQSRGAVVHIIQRLLEASGTAPDDPRLKYVAMPRVGAKIVATTYAAAAHSVTTAPHFHAARTTGHLGAGDLAANLHDLLRQPDVAPGDVLILLSAGAGFTISGVAVSAGSVSPVLPSASGTEGHPTA